MAIASPTSTTRQRTLLQWGLLLAACVASRLLTTVGYIEDADSLRFALSVADAYDVAALQPHFPGYPVFWAVAKPLYLLTGRFSVAFALVGGLATFGLTAAGLRLLEGAGRRVPLASPLGLAWTVLVFFAPLIWLLGNRYMPDLLGLALLLGATALLLEAAASDDRRTVWAAGFAAGLLAGLRLSYVPFIALPVLMLLVRSRHRAELVTAGLAGVGIWLVPLVVDTGWAELVAAGGRQTVGHFTDFGGTLESEPAGLEMRILRTLEAVWADGLGGWWPGRHAATLVVSAALLAMTFGGVRAVWKSSPAVRRTAGWLLACAAVYGIWIVAYQNVLYKSRHVLPLLAMVLLLLAHGAAWLWSRRWGRGVVAIGLAAYIGVTAVLVIQHRRPTAIAQITEVARQAAAENPDLQIVSIPLVTYMLAAQQIDAVYVDTDEPEALARLRDEAAAGAPVLAVGAPLPFLGRHHVQADTFYHNPYVNRMWPEVPVYVYLPGDVHP